MQKNDLQILIISCVAAVLLIITNFGSFVKSLDFIDTETFQQSDFFKSYQSFKESEGSFWTKLKGTESNSGEISDVLKETPPEQNAKQQTTVIPQKITPPVKFLLVGDSMMLVGFGPALENQLLKFQGVSVVREGQYSTGLNRIDYFDWFTKTDELINQHKPDVLIVMFGGNDGQGIKDKDGKAHELGSESWKEVYRQRVGVYLSRTSPKVKKIYWVGHPIAGNENFMNKFLAMNPIYKSECEKFPNAVFVDSWERFAVNGQYRQSIPDDNGLWQIAKQSDGVHVTDFGGGILAGLVIKEVLKDVEIK